MWWGEANNILCQEDPENNTRSENIAKYSRLLKRVLKINPEKNDEVCLKGLNLKRLEILEDEQGKSQKECLLKRLGSRSLRTTIKYNFIKKTNSGVIDNANQDK